MLNINNTNMFRFRLLGIKEFREVHYNDFDSTSQEVTQYQIFVQKVLQPNAEIKTTTSFTNYTTGTSFTTTTGFTKSEITNVNVVEKKQRDYSNAEQKQRENKEEIKNVNVDGHSKRNDVYVIEATNRYGESYNTVGTWGHLSKPFLWKPRIGSLHYVPCNPETFVELAGHFCTHIIDTEDCSGTFAIVLKFPARHGTETNQIIETNQQVNQITEINQVKPNTETEKNAELNENTKVAQVTEIKQNTEIKQVETKHIEHDLCLLSGSVDAGFKDCPCGGAFLNKGLLDIGVLRKTEYLKEKRQIYVFQGASGIGKSFLASFLKLEGNLQVYDTDSHQELPDILWENHVISIGSKYLNHKTEVFSVLEQQRQINLSRLGKSNDCTDFDVVQYMLIHNNINFTSMSTIKVTFLIFCCLVIFVFVHLACQMQSLLSTFLLPDLSRIVLDYDFPRIGQHVRVLEQGYTFLTNTEERYRLKSVNWHGYVKEDCKEDCIRYLPGYYCVDIAPSWSLEKLVCLKLCEFVPCTCHP